MITQETSSSSAPIAAPIVAKRYYTNCPTLTLRTSLGREILDHTTGARVSRVEEKFATFRQIGPEVGVYETADPVEQAKLDELIRSGRDDLFTEEQYATVSRTPDSVIAEQSQELAAARKEIEELQLKLASRRAPEDSGRKR